MKQTSIAVLQRLSLTTGSTFRVFNTTLLHAQTPDAYVTAC